MNQLAGPLETFIIFNYVYMCLYVESVHMSADAQRSEASDPSRVEARGICELAARLPISTATVLTS